MSARHSLRSRVNAELEALRQLHDGFLKQEHVVQAARVEGSALHEDFSRQGLWDEARAAERARLEYAGRIIRLYVVVRDEEREPVRALVSIMSDRTSDERPGYRSIDDVLADEELSQALLATALMELRAFRRKYQSLQALTGIFVEIETLEKRHEATRKRSAGDDDRTEARA
jgi:hypothetical protein